MRLPGSNGNRFLISSITTPYTLRAGYTVKKEKTRQEGAGDETKKLKSRLVTNTSRIFLLSFIALIHA